MPNVNYSDFLSNLNEYERLHAPKELFFEGDPDLLFFGTRVSVVGSRKVSDLGIERTKRIVKTLVQNGFIVVSGLAEGVDTIAHKYAIELGGRTITVLGTPLDECFPASNRNLLNEIKRDHLAISQFPKGSRTFKSNFPLRNRTMALISDATIIIEAKEDSGTRHQGWEAIRIGRSLFLLENVMTNSWAKQMLNYDTTILTSKNYKELISDIYSITSKFNEIEF